MYNHMYMYMYLNDLRERPTSDRTDVNLEVHTSSQVSIVHGYTCMYGVEQLGTHVHLLIGCFVAG